MADNEAEPALNAEGNGVTQRMSDRSKVGRGFGEILFYFLQVWFRYWTNFAPFSVFFFLDRLEGSS
jgi:hypothetical protein